MNLKIWIMNEIIKQRIEEAAKRYAWSHDTIGVDKETFHTEYSQKHPIPINKEVRVPIAHEMEVAFKCAANFILQHQWISVEEALPEETEDGFCDDKFVLYCSEYPATASYDHKSKKWYYGDYEILGVTHWMPIPSLEGGKE
jgi:hypothetical protein